MRIDWTSAGDIGAVEPIWRALSAAAVGPRPYFHSWGWVETWLRSLPSLKGIKLGVIRDTDGAPLGGFFLGSKLKRRGGVLLAMTKHVNQTGDDVIDELCIEYNSLMCAPSAKARLQEILENIPGVWDELYFSGMDAESFPGESFADPVLPYRLEVLKRTPSYFVDLQAVRAKGDYLSVVGSKTRAQLRRTYRTYEGEGAVSTEVAADLATSLSIYRELISLHQQHWNAQGFAGAFATPYFRNFHEQLIRARHESGEIQLLRVRVAGRTVGCIYGFNYDGTLYQYQTGMLYEEDDRHRRPGFLCNSEAIKYCAKLGLDRYDFLGGTQSYKRQLSTGERSLVWARVQKPRLRFFVERTAKKLLRAWRARRQPPVVSQPAVVESSADAPNQPD